MADALILMDPYTTVKKITQKVIHELKLLYFSLLEIWKYMSKGDKGIY